MRRIYIPLQEWEEAALRSLARSHGIAVEEMASRIGGVNAAGIFYIVRVRVANHARRVDFTFHPDTVLLIDDDGTEHDLSKAGQDALDAGGKHETGGNPMRAGTQYSRDLVFEMPA